jgi:hypothetical protein
MTELVREHTPARTGEVRESYEQVPVVRESRGGRTAYRSGVESHHWRAPFVEHGVRPHDIEPRPDEPEGAEAIETPAGPRARVHHPGYPGVHSVSRAAAEVEAGLPELLRPEAEAWAAEMTAAAKRRRGIT